VIEYSGWDQEEWQKKDIDLFSDGEKIAYYILQYNDVVLIKELGKLYRWENGVFVEFTDTEIDFKTKIALDFFNENLPVLNEKGKVVIPRLKFTKTTRHQILLHLGYNLLSLKQFDQHDHIINCKNGIVDLTGFEDFKEHPSIRGDHYLSLIQIPIKYNKDALCPQILSFIIDVFGIDRFPFIYEIIGYMLYKTNKFHKAFIFFGEASSGKTTFIEMLRKFLGLNNTQDVSIQKINQRFQMAHLRDKLANIYDDLPIKKLGYIANFKQITSNKTLTGEIKGVQNLVTWPNFCKQIYTTNDLPPVDENTGDDFWRRIILIHCTKFFNNGNKDFDIGDKISTEEEFSGLLNKVIFHFKDLYKRKHFHEKYDNIDTVKGVWQINISPLKLFLDEYCSITNSKSDFEEADDFRAQLNAFRKTKNGEAISMNMITRRLKDLGVVKKQKANGKRYYTGIKINTRILGEDTLTIHNYTHTGKIDMDTILVNKSERDVNKIEKKILDTFGGEIDFE